MIHWNLAVDEYTNVEIDTCLTLVEYPYSHTTEVGKLRPAAVCCYEK